MSANSDVVNRLEQRAQQANQIIPRLKSQLNDMKKSAVSANIDKQASLLQAENAQLQAEVQKALKKLVALETSHGIIQIPLPRSLSSQASKDAPGSEDNSVKGQSSDPVLENQSGVEQAKPARKSAKTENKDKKNAPAVPTAEPDITQVDLRIGRIIEVKTHPDADSLYMEQIDLGEGSPRTVVTKLVKHVKMEEMQNRLVIVYCNIKPVEIRGVLSQVMIMCAATADKVEILIPPEGAVPGDRVSCEGYELGNYPPQMNHKKKIFEQIKPYIRTDANKVACYKGAPFKVEGKGVCVAPTLSDANYY